MKYLVNGQAVPEDLISQESARISRDLRWQAIPGDGERAARLRAAAVQSAIDKVLVEQAAARDPRPIDPGVIEEEVARTKSGGMCRSAFDDSAARQWADKQLRIQRTLSEMMSGARKPTAAEVEDCYNAYRDKFRNPEAYQAAHIVKHVNGDRNEEQARAAIEVALAELQRGEPFAEVADRHSDCKGSGGDLGRFLAGQMVPEFDDAIRALEPGQRTGVFRTPFGFHIAELRDKTPGGPAAFEQMREQIERTLMMMNQHEVYIGALAELRSCAEIREDQSE